MQPTPEQVLESLEAIIDKYETPELFSFLDFYELQFNGNAARSGEGIVANAIVSYTDSGTTENGIVTEIKDDTCYVNFYGQERTISVSSPNLAKSATKILPLEWAEKDAWGDARRFMLKTLSSYLSLAHHFDKIQSLSNSRTQILGHQIESTYKIVSSINPRFLIADEVGLGKTVEAGLIIKEFIIRHNYSRILIVVPASLQFQWQQEMKEKFNESFVIIDGRTLARLGNKLPDKTIISLDFAKQERIKELLLKKKWDTLVFDEAHKLRRDATNKTQAYTLAEEMSQKVNVLLLLSATPFSGKLEELYYLVRLLNPSLLGSINKFMLDYASNKKDDLKTRLSSVLIRRRKVDVGGFTRRFAKTISFEFTDEEQALYERTTAYIRNEYNKALETKNNIHYFILTVYQKMLDLSSRAIIHTIASRIEYLEKALGIAGSSEDTRPDKSKSALQAISRTLEGNAEEPEDAEKLAGCAYSNEVAEEMKKELQSLREIHRLAIVIRINKKGEILKKIIAKILKEDKNTKVLIFTQFARTQDYLLELLAEYKVSFFNGSMDKKAKDRAILAFRKETNILVSTEAGGEGRNLQFCHYLINYDLPWNPQKIEQRIGRLHRFGQTKDVKIYNFSTKDTIGARILDVLENKIKIFEDSIGATDTLLGYYEEEIDFNATFMKFHSDPDKVCEELDKKITKMKGSFEYLEELTAHKVLDFNLDAFYDATRKERFINNKLIQRMMEVYARLPGSDISITKLANAHDLFTLASLTTGERAKGYFASRKAILHPESEFFAFGNAVVDRCAEKMQEPSFLGLTAKIRIDTDSAIPRCEGIMFNFIVNIRGNKMSRDLIPVFVDTKMIVTQEAESRIVSEYLRFKFKEDAGLQGEELEPGLLSQLYQRAILTLEIRIKEKLETVKEDIDKQIGLTIPMLNKHYESIFSELDDLLQVQKSKEKIYNITTMKSIIKRTENKIKQFKQQRDTEIERIKNIKFLHTSYQLLNLAYVAVN